MGISPEKLNSIHDRMHRLGLYEKDIEESFIRSGGAGGQNVNKTATCVRLFHHPSRIEVKCQISRSQIDNRFFARRILCDKYESQELKQKTEKEREIHRIRKQKRRRSRRAKEKMLIEKKQRGDIKKLRKPFRTGDE